MPCASGFCYLIKDEKIRTIRKGVARLVTSTTTKSLGNTTVSKAFCFACYAVFRGCYTICYATLCNTLAFFRCTISPIKNIFIKNALSVQHDIFSKVDSIYLYLCTLHTLTFLDTAFPLHIHSFS